MKSVLLPIKSVKVNPNNPRILKDEKFNKLKQSITDAPWMLDARPIVIDEDNIVLGGNMRYQALKDLGYKEIHCVQLANLTPEQKQEFIIKDNVSFGEWDWEVLANEWDVEKLEEWGLELPVDTVEHLEAEEDNFEVAPERTKTNIVLGDLIEIGRHRLLCGDSTDSDQVAKLMNGELADVAHNDPPYGMKKESDGVLNDNLNYEDLLKFNREWIALQFTHLKENGSWYCWGIDEPLMDIYNYILKPYIKNQKATFRNLITWDKGFGQGQNSDLTRSYAIADEKCLFVMCGVQGFNNNSDNYFEGWEPIRLYLESEANKVGLTPAKCKEITSVGMFSHWFTKSQWCLIPEKYYNKLRIAFSKEYDAFSKEYDALKKEYYSTRAYFNNTHDNFNNVWHFDRHIRQGNEGNHATPKPIPLCERALLSSCPDSGLAIDFFLGSGSTMVAAHQLNRKCYGMELDPVYCQVIIDRMLALDSSLEVKINSEAYEPAAK